MASVHRILAALACPGLLLAGGCVSLLPTSPPAQLYRFGFEPRTPTAAAAAAAAVPSFRLTLVSIVLPAASAGSGILTSRGDSVAYIARARWAAPAAIRVDEAALQAFAGADVSLTRATSGTVAGLALEVRTLEARYAEASAPAVRIVVHAVLTRPDGQPFAERTFASEETAEANRVSAIVLAYSGALTDDLTAIKLWSAGALRATVQASAPEGSARP